MKNISNEMQDPALPPLRAYMSFKEKDLRKRVRKIEETLRHGP